MQDLKVVPGMDALFYNLHTGTNLHQVTCLLNFHFIFNYFAFFSLHRVVEKVLSLKTLLEEIFYQEVNKYSFESNDLAPQLLTEAVKIM